MSTFVCPNCLSAFLLYSLFVLYRFLLVHFLRRPPVTGCPDKNDIKCGFLNEFSRLRIVVDFMVEIAASGPLKGATEGFLFVLSFQRSEAKLCI